MSVDTTYPGADPDETTTVGRDGTWTVTVTAPLSEGTHTITATQTGADGAPDPAAAEDSVRITVDVSAPDAPVITSPETGDDVDRRPTVTGTAEPGSVVTVLGERMPLDSTPADSTPADSDTPLGDTRADEAGDWSLTLPEPLDPGYTLLYAEATDAAGNISEDSEPVVVHVSGNAAPVRISSPKDGSTVPVGTRVTGTGEPGSEILVAAFPGDVSDELAAQSEGFSARAGSRGRSTHQAAVRSMVDGLRSTGTGSSRLGPDTEPDDLGDTTVTADGRWGVAEHLDPGTYTVIAGQLSPDGDVMVCDPVVFTVAVVSGGTSGSETNGGGTSGSGTSGGGTSGSGVVATGSAPGTLAETGGPTLFWPAAGGLLVLAGGLLLAARRRRAQADSRTTNR